MSFIEKLYYYNDYFNGWCVYFKRNVLVLTYNNSRKFTGGEYYFVNVDRRYKFL